MCVRMCIGFSVAFISRVPIASAENTHTRFFPHSQSAPLPTTGVPLPTGQLTRSSSAVGAPRNSAPDGLSSFPGLQRNSSSAGSRNTGFRSTQFHEAQPRFQVQQQAGQTQQQPAERRQPKRPSKGFLLRQERERKKELLASRKNVPTEVGCSGML